MFKSFLKNIGLDVIGDESQINDNESKLLNNYDSEGDDIVHSNKVLIIEKNNKGKMGEIIDSIKSKVKLNVLYYKNVPYNELSKYEYLKNVKNATVEKIDKVAVIKPLITDEFTMEKNLENSKNYLEKYNKFIDTQLKNVPINELIEMYILQKNNRYYIAQKIGDTFKLFKSKIHKYEILYTLKENPNINLENIYGKIPEKTLRLLLEESKDRTQNIDFNIMINKKLDSLDLDSYVEYKIIDTKTYKLTGTDFEKEYKFIVNKDGKSEEFSIKDKIFMSSEDMSIRGNIIKYIPDIYRIKYRENVILPLRKIQKIPNKQGSFDVKIKSNLPIIESETKIEKIMEPVYVIRVYSDNSYKDISLTKNEFMFIDIEDTKTSQIYELVENPNNNIFKVMNLKTRQIETLKNSSNLLKNFENFTNQQYTNTEIYKDTELQLPFEKLEELDLGNFEEEEQKIGVKDIERTIMKYEKNPLQEKFKLKIESIAKLFKLELNDYYKVAEEIYTLYQIILSKIKGTEFEEYFDEDKPLLKYFYSLAYYKDLRKNYIKIQGVNTLDKYIDALYSKKYFSKNDYEFIPFKNNILFNLTWNDELLSQTNYSEKDCKSEIKCIRTLMYNAYKIFSQIISEINWGEFQTINKDALPIKSTKKYLYEYNLSNKSKIEGKDGKIWNFGIISKTGIEQEDNGKQKKYLKTSDIMKGVDTTNYSQILWTNNELIIINQFKKEILQQIKINKNNTEKYNLWKCVYKKIDNIIPEINKLKQNETLDSIEKNCLIKLERINEKIFDKIHKLSKAQGKVKLNNESESDTYTYAMNELNNNFYMKEHSHYNFKNLMKEKNEKLYYETFEQARKIASLRKDVIKKFQKDISNILEKESDPFKIKILTLIKDNLNNLQILQNYVKDGMFENVNEVSEIINKFDKELKEKINTLIRKKFPLFFEKDEYLKGSILYNNILNKINNELQNELENSQDKEVISIVIKNLYNLQEFYDTLNKTDLSEFDKKLKQYIIPILEKINNQFGNELTIISPDEKETEETEFEFDEIGENEKLEAKRLKLFKKFINKNKQKNTNMQKDYFMTEDEINDFMNSIE